MYLRQSNKWKDYLLQEAIEQQGLPPEVVAMIRDLSNELGSVPEKVLTSLGTMVRSYSYATPLIIDWMSPSDGDNKFRSNPAISDLQAILYDRRKPRSERTAEDEAFRKEMDRDFIHPLVAGTTGNNPDNPRLENILDTNRYRKRYVKKLKKAGLTEKAEASDKVFVDAMVKWAEKFVMPELEPIIKAVVEDPNDYESILRFVSLIPDKRKLITARIKAKRLLEREPEEPQNVVHKFDNGYYWYDIKSDACTIEGEKMGHCGKGLAGGNLYSLRSPSGTKKDPDPHVTIEMTNAGVIHQIKGKANAVPDEKYWPYIAWFVENMNPTSYYEEKLGRFKGLVSYLKKINPDLFAVSFHAFAQEWADGWYDQMDVMLTSEYQISVNDINVFVSPDEISEGDKIKFGAIYILKYNAGKTLPEEWFKISNLEKRTKAFKEMGEHIQSKILPKYFSTGTSSTLPEVEGREVSVVTRLKTISPGFKEERFYELKVPLIWKWEVKPPEDPKSKEQTAAAIENLEDTGVEAYNLIQYLIGVEARFGGSKPDIQPKEIDTLQRFYNTQDGQGTIDMMGFERELEKYFDSLGFAASDEDLEDLRISSLPRLDETVTFDRWAKIIK